MSFLLIVRREMKTLSPRPASDELNRFRHDGTRPIRHDDLDAFRQWAGDGGNAKAAMRPRRPTWMR
jgi:hypothetical protein